MKRIETIAMSKENKARKGTGDRRDRSMRSINTQHHTYGDMKK
jgi:hypothetical protein